MRRVISLFLIIAGVLIIAVPLIGRYRTKKLQQAMLEEFYANNQVEQTEEYMNTHQSNLALDDIFKWGDVEENQKNITPIGANEEDLVNQNEMFNEVTEDAYSDSLHEKSNHLDDHYQKPKAIAIIKIDKIDVHLPIAKGMNAETLKFAIGYMPESGKFGEIGNAVLAGHRSHTYGVFFNRLNELEQGDEIVIITKGKEYIYTVYDKKIVDPDDLSVMRGSSKFKVITLITCDPVIGATHRLIIHGMMK